MDKKTDNKEPKGLVVDLRMSDEENLHSIEDRGAPNGSRSQKYLEKRKFESELPAL